MTEPKGSRGTLDHQADCECTRCTARRRGWNLETYRVKLSPDLRAAVVSRGPEWVRQTLAAAVAE